ncbi:MAG: 4'-phosphopantetheinyl transferase superfamily protein [Bdellovibrio sp.]|nr:4'-phosphopantetheinyl transferase superfamily protein [Bdellovibrio sp.]
MDYPSPVFIQDGSFYDQLSMALFRLDSQWITEKNLDNVLNINERNKFNSFKVQKRKETFFYGRLAAKTALQTYFPKFLKNEICIKNSNKDHASVYPMVIFEQGALPMGSVSISHSGQYAVASFHPLRNIGIDLEQVADRDEEFFNLNFTLQEKAMLRSLPDDLLFSAFTLLWTAKEAMSKAIGKGLTLSTMQMESFIDREKLFLFLNDKNKGIIYFGKIIENNIENDIENDIENNEERFFSLKSQFFLPLYDNKKYIFTTAMHC